MNEPTKPPISALLSHDERQIVAAVNIPDEGRLTDEQRGEVRDNVQQYRADNGISLKTFARSIGLVRDSTWSQILTGTYPSVKLDTYLRAANRWVEDDARRRSIRGQPSYVLTSVAQTIRTTVELAKQNRAIYVCIGPTGVGKTRCAEVAREQFPGTILVTLHGDLRTRYHVRDTLVYKLGLNRVRGRRKNLPVREFTSALFERLQGSGRLIIVDEGHQIAKSGLDFLRDLYDHTGCPILILATMDLWQEIIKQADEDRGQFYSRVRRCVDLTDEVKTDTGKRLFHADDIRKIFETRKFKVHLDRGAVDYLRRVANDFGRGSLRTCTNLVEDAATLIRNREKVPQDSWVTLDLQMLANCHKESRRERITSHWVEECFADATVAAAG